MTLKRKANGMFSKKTVEEIRDILKNKYPDYEYIGGYTTIDGSLVLRCQKCGSEFNHTAQILRPSRNKNIKCFGCIKKEREQKLMQEKERKTLEKARKDFLRMIKKRVSQIEKEEKKNVISVCHHCGKEFKGNRKYCSDKCMDRHSEYIKHMRKRLRINSSDAIDKDITLNGLIKRDKNICHICGKKCNGEDYIINNGAFIVGGMYPSIDHVKPIAKGGTHTWDNIKLAHKRCNSSKSDKEIYPEANGQLKLSI